MSAPELSVVCKSCGAEVSPYVTECPYCGKRLRKRAPKLERHGDELHARERRRRTPKARRPARRSLALEAGRPYATIVAILVPALALVVERASGLTVLDLGAIASPVGEQSWHYLAAPLVYDDLGYLFVCAVALGIFMPPVEGRLGPVPALILALACGALGMLAAVGVDDALGDGIAVAAGGNGLTLGVLACWIVLADAERRADPAVEWDRIAVAVAAAVLLALPLVEDFADPWAGLAGGLVGGVCGFAATRGGRRTT